MVNYTLTNKGWHPGLNYWVANPQVGLIPKFKKLKDLDDGKELSSKYMWMVVFLVENDEDVNKFKRIPEASKIEMLKESFFPEFDPYLPEFIEAKEAYPDYMMGTAQVALYNQQLEINRIQEFIKETPLTWDEPDPVGKMRVIPGTAKQIAALSKTVNGMLKDLKDLEEMFQLSKTEAEVFGGRKETLAEKGVI